MMEVTTRLAFLQGANDVLARVQERDSVSEPSAYRTGIINTLQDVIDVVNRLPDQALEEYEERISQGKVPKNLGNPARIGGWAHSSRQVIPFVSRWDARASTELLNLVIDHGIPELVEGLVTQGADIHAQSDGRTPLMLASMLGDLPIIRFLLACGARVNEKSKDGQGITALMAAVASGYPEVVSILLAHGADPGAKSIDGFMALKYAHIARILPQHGEKDYNQVIAMLESKMSPQKRDKAVVVDINSRRGSPKKLS